MDFAPLVEGDLPQRLISGLWQIDARMLDVGWRPAASSLRWGASSARKGSISRQIQPVPTADFLGVRPLPTDDPFSLTGAMPCVSRFMRASRPTMEGCPTTDQQA
jgi:hypothetical protein